MGQENSLIFIPQHIKAITFSSLSQVWRHGFGLWCLWTRECDEWVELVVCLTYHVSMIGELPTQWKKTIFQRHVDDQNNRTNRSNNNRLHVQHLVWLCRALQRYPATTSVVPVLPVVPVVPVVPLASCLFLCGLVFPDDWYPCFDP